MEDKEQIRHEDIVKQMKIDNNIDIVLVIISLATLILIATKKEI